MNNYKLRTSPVTYEELESLYHIFKYSIPGRNEIKSHYFTALPAEKLTAHEIMMGVNRQTAKDNLEMAIIEGVLNNSLKWYDDSKWFWQSSKDPDFVLLRKWILNEKAGESSGRD